MTNREAAVAEVKALFNRICIVHDSDLVRVVGFHEDGMDYYYRVRCRERDARNGRTEWYATYVGACVSLEGVERYEHIEADFTRGGCPPAEAFLDTVADRVENHLCYGAMIVDGLHPDVDRIELSDRKEGDPVWFAIVRENDRAIVSIQEHDAQGMVEHTDPADGDWAALITARILERDGMSRDLARAVERTTANESEALRDYPEIMNGRAARSDEKKD